MPDDFSSDQGGAALIEGALVLPVLLLLVLGIVDISFYFWTSGLAGKATQLGLRQAIVSNAVAVGPGLSDADSATYWAGLPPGLPCASSPGVCPQFTVTCSMAEGCRCTGTICGFHVAADRLSPILKAMQAVMPNLRPDNLEIAYSTNQLGYVAEPVPVPVNVRLTLVGVHYTPLFLRELLGSAMPIRASAELPSESLVSP